MSGAFAATRVATMATPCGPFTVMMTGDCVVASGWAADATSLVAWLAPVSRPGGWHIASFVESAWDALRAVPAGCPVTYRELAVRCGRAGAARAAGSACQRNAAALFVPCHRVVRGDGGLGGFRWGLAVKRWLLDHEAASRPEHGQAQTGAQIGAHVGARMGAQMGSLLGMASVVR
jgi:methylated-DNA-[protein]-cysteine S-methyltransferase